MTLQQAVQEALGALYLEVLTLRVRVQELTPAPQPTEPPAKDPV